MPMVYYPLTQEYATHMTVVARTTGDPLRLAGAVRAEARRLSGAIPVFGVRSLSAHLEGALGNERLTAMLVGMCGFVALALATIGVYGVVSYAVSRRTQEIGIRIALGAAPGRILRLVLGGGLALTSAGLAVGLAGAMGVTRFTESLLFGVTPHDTWTFTLVTALLLGVAMLATYLPARRAMRVDPVVALRQE
jgi:ABC-type antimicrobial peptide transport system permease subunit